MAILSFGACAIAGELGTTKPNENTIDKIAGELILQIFMFPLLQGVACLCQS